MYNTTANVWSEYSNSIYTHQDRSGAVYLNQIYLQDPVNPEVFDPVSQEWNSWPALPVDDGGYSCLLMWKDSFLNIGGHASKQTVFQFNHTMHLWTKLDSVALSIEVDHSGCAVLPNEDILVVGSYNSPYKASAALYNVKENTWTSLGNTTYERRGTSLLTLGERIFVIGGDGSVGRSDDVIEEFIVKDNTWVEVDSKLIISRSYHSTLSVPASLFAHLEGGCEGVK